MMKGLAKIKQKLTNSNLRRRIKIMECNNQKINKEVDRRNSAENNYENAIENILDMSFLRGLIDAIPLEVRYNLAVLSTYDEFQKEFPQLLVKSVLRDSRDKVFPCHQDKI